MTAERVGTSPAPTSRLVAPNRWLAASAWLTAGHGAAVALRLAGLLVVARVAGVEAIGLIGIGLAIASGMAMLFSGIQTAAIIAVSRQPESAVRLRSVAVRRQLGVAALTYGALASAVVLLDLPDPGVLLLFGLSAFTQALGLRWLLVATAEARLVAIASALAAVAFLAGCLVLADADHLWRIALLHVGVEMALAATFWLRSRPVVADRPGAGNSDGAALEGLGWARTSRLSALHVARIAPITVSVVVAAVTLDTVEAGRFALLQRATLAAIALVALHSEAGTAPLVGRGGSVREVSRATKPVAVGAAALAVVALLLADPIAAAVLDEGYEGLGFTAMLLVLAIGIAFLSGPRVQIAVADGGDDRVMRLAMGAAIGTVALMIALAYVGQLAGIAAAELLGQVGFLAALLIVGPRPERWS